jgi:hypothetical protein
MRRRWPGRLFRAAAQCSGIALLAACGCTPERARLPHMAAPSPFIITFWCAPPLAELDDQRAAEIAAAGFTTIGPPCSGGLDPASNARVLDIAARHRLDVWVADHRISPNQVDTGDWPAPLRAAVAMYRAAPALSGYFVTDEPTADDFAAVAAVVAALRAADPHRLAYVNLLPDYIPAAALGTASYAEYVEQFLANVRPDLLSYDYYPFGEKKDRSSFFANLEVIRAAALRHHVPFMLVVLLTPHGPYRDPTAAELAWQVHHALAFGARGVSYFTYWTPDGDSDWTFRDGIIEGGRPTRHYTEVATLNRELRALGHALDGFTSFAVADSAGEIGVPFPIGPIAAIHGERITAGLFSDAAGRLVVLLVNRDYRAGTTAVLQLTPGAHPPEVFDSETSTWHAPGRQSFPLAPGGAQLLCWAADPAGCAG